MPDDTDIVILTQPDDERLRHDHAGVLGLHGEEDAPPVRHRFHGEVDHMVGGAKGRPLVHLVGWESEPFPLEVSGRVVLAGDRETPVPVEMSHRFETVHDQHFDVEPLDHTLHVDTGLASPIHHALQMRTPLELRFCNPWHVDSDYTVDVRLGERPLLSINLRGSTRATPEPCDNTPCPPVRAQVMRP